MHNGKIICELEKSKVIDCEECGFLHIFPLPSIETTELLYSKEYYEINRANYISNLVEDESWWKNLYKERLNLVLSQMKTVDKPKVLDIGTGAGYFLQVAKENNCLELGIEPSQMASFYAKEQGLNVMQDFYSDKVSSEIGQFDIVHMNHVLEHMDNPIKVLNNIKNNLVENGLLCVAVPNDFNELQDIASKLNHDKKWWISPEEHLNYFSFRSLSRLLNRCGFDILEKTTSFPMELFILMGENYIEEKALGRECHFRRKEFEINLFQHNIELKQRFYSSLAEQGLGRDVIIIARKRVENHEN